VESTYMTNVDVAPAVRQFISRELAPGTTEADLGDDVSLLESGILDSFGIMTLLSFLEDSFQVRIPVERIEPANFETVAAISMLVDDVKNHS
jgi:acyl carrier protein